MRLPQRSGSPLFFRFICNAPGIMPASRQHDTSTLAGTARRRRIRLVWYGGQPMRLHDTAIHTALAALLVASSALTSPAAVAQVIDPGVRQAGTANGPPPPLARLTADERASFQDGLARLPAVKMVRSPTGDNSGLGPRFNSNSCASCHIQPVVGGSSPSVNPLPAVAHADSATNAVPWFIVSNGPIREARFVSDGGVHDLFVVLPPPNSAVLSDMEGFADFMRMLGPPVPAQPTVSTQHGAAVFTAVGCGLCHTPVLATGPAIADGDEDTPSIALSNRPARLFSDLLVHHMGAALADGITQGSAGPDEFRTAPLWGVGQRVFFLHDGRTSNLIHAIRLHASAGSEATLVALTYFSLSAQDQQDLIYFLSSL